MAPAAEAVVCLLPTSKVPQTHTQGERKGYPVGVGSGGEQGRIKRVEQKEWGGVLKKT